MKAKNVYAFNENPLEKGYKSKTFKAAQFNKADLDHVMKQQGHLDGKQQQQLLQVL